MREILRRHLPTDDVQRAVASERLILLLVRNVLVSRESLYAMPEWVARHSPELFDLYHTDDDGGVLVYFQLDNGNTNDDLGGFGRQRLLSALVAGQSRSRRP